MGCVPIGDCGAYAWCDQDKHVAWCREQAQTSSCPVPFCKRLPNPEREGEAESEPELEQESEIEGGAEAESATEIKADAESEPEPEPQRKTEAEPEPEREPEAEPEPQRESVLCVPIGDCGAHAWCDQDKHVAWCREQVQMSGCPAPFCKSSPNLAQLPARKHLRVAKHGFHEVLAASFIQQSAEVSPAEQGC